MKIHSHFDFRSSMWEAWLVDWFGRVVDTVGFYVDEASAVEAGHERWMADVVFAAKA